MELALRLLTEHLVCRSRPWPISRQFRLQLANPLSANVATHRERIPPEAAYKAICDSPHRSDGGVTSENLMTDASKAYQVPADG